MDTWDSTVLSHGVEDATMVTFTRKCQLPGHRPCRKLASAQYTVIGTHSDLYLCPDCGRELITRGLVTLKGIK